jgi:hypothetical protein
VTIRWIECLRQVYGAYYGPEPAYRASCPACGTTGETRSSPVQAKAALAEIHGTCTAAAIPLPEKA